MKTKLHILVPPSVTLYGITNALEAMLAPHRLREEHSVPSEWRFDYLCEFDATLKCAVTNAELPKQLYSTYAGYISRVDRLRPDVSAGALITPDGTWHDASDCGFRMMNEPEANRIAMNEWTRAYRTLLKENPDCWVIEKWAHS